MIPARVIEEKRNGGTLPAPVLRSFFEAYLAGEVEEYQMAALLMAIYFEGLGTDELATLTSVMIESGEVLDFTHLGRRVVDKHSTGGVGDKVSIALAPLAAELGVSVPMMAGRGLGHTGGTVDKLEAIPGFRTDLDIEDFVSVLEGVGCATIGQTDRIAPLDRRLYDLRSVTATVPSLPLIASSILSKKLAEGLDGLVLDVKVGEGAFLPEEESALELARTMVGIGNSRGVETVALLTAMDRPLGRTVGNALEIAEAVACLGGGGPDDLREIVVALATEMVGMADHATDRGRVVERLNRALDDGSALDRFGRMVEAQGGDPRVTAEPEAVLGSAPVVRGFDAERAGFVRRVTPTRLGYGVVQLGGGRTRLGQSIDHRVGFRLDVTAGDRVDEGDRVARVYAASEADCEVGFQVLAEAVEIGEDEPPGHRPLISHRVTRDGVSAWE